MPRSDSRSDSYAPYAKADAAGHAETATAVQIVHIMIICGGLMSSETTKQKMVLSVIIIKNY